MGLVSRHCILEWRLICCLRFAPVLSLAQSVSVFRGDGSIATGQMMDSWAMLTLFSSGNAIYAEIPGTEVETKAPLEGGVYVISRFRVSNAKSGYKPAPIPGPYMIVHMLHQN